MVKMKFKALVFLGFLVIHLSIPGLATVEGASSSFVEGAHEFYIVKEVIDVTSDWQDITWNRGPEVHAVRHRVVEGADAVENLEVRGLTAWITQKSLDTVKVVLEIEALVLRGDEEAQVVIEKGAIGSANVELTVYDASAGSFSEVTEFGTGRMFREFEFDLASVYAEPAGALVLEGVSEGSEGEGPLLLLPLVREPPRPLRAMGPLAGCHGGLDIRLRTLPAARSLRLQR